ncbi:MAG: hypothetical protein HY782_08690 [Chloroflexi bacterium]|nr:hypothetical protein [Chloroflexota bacterium]
MAKRVTDLPSQKVTVAFPQPLLRQLKEKVAPRERGAFIVQAVAEKLALQEQLTAIEESAGIWSAESHPELKTDADIDRWLGEIRRTWTRPLSDREAQHGKSHLPSG